MRIWTTITPTILSENIYLSIYLPIYHYDATVGLHDSRCITLVFKKHVIVVVIIVVIA